MGSSHRPSLPVDSVRPGRGRRNGTAPGGTGPLPFRVGEGKYDVPTDPYDDGGDPLFDPGDADSGGFEEVPEVDPDAL